MNKKRVVSYTRVSTTHQSTELQERDIVSFIKSKGHTLVAGYRDIGFSGAKSSRPELNQLMESARRDEFDILVIWKLDRLARSLSHLVTLITELKQLGIELISLRDNIDFTTAQGRLMFGIFASLAEFEREIIRERVMAGLNNAKLNGKRLGRIKTIDDEKVSYLHQKGFSIREIAATLNASRSGVHKVLAHGFSGQGVLST